MKTPEESKCGMECIRTNVERLCIKPEKGQCPRCKQLVDDSLAYILQLETERHQLLTKCERLERERDALVRELRDVGTCDGCIHGLDLMIHDSCIACRRFHPNDSDGMFDHWQWRGVCEENTKEEQAQ